MEEATSKQVLRVVVERVMERVVERGRERGREPVVGQMVLRSF